MTTAFTPALSIKPGRTVFVSGWTGSDTTGDGSFNKPYATFTKAISTIDGSGWEIIAFPGTYAESPTSNVQNATFSALGVEQGGLVNVTGTFTFSHPASSARVAGISIATVAHTGAGSLYLNTARAATALNKSGAGYLEVIDCDTQGSGTGAISITGAGPVVFQGGKIGFLTVNNASAAVIAVNQVNAAPMTLTAGVLALGVGSIYSTSGTGNAITATGGTLILDGPTLLTPTGTQARMSIGAGALYRIQRATYDTANSIISGTALPAVLGVDTLAAASGLQLGETASTAYRGDRGKTAYDHSQTTGNPHNTTKSNIGLGNVDNTSDADKPVSTATATALATKQDTLTLTTTGTSGAATLVGNTLNIPQYSGGGASINVTVQANSTTQPSPANEGDILLVTTTGTSAGTVTEQWTYTGESWLQVAGSQAVSGSVLDNTIADPELITVAGRYIVPASGTLNTFVGQENKYYTTDLVTGTFSTPSQGDTVMVTSGTNTGLVYTYDATTKWSVKTQTTGVPMYYYAQASAWAAGSVVIRLGDGIYQANSAIPANTAFAVGTSGATWTAIAQAVNGWNWSDSGILRSYSNNQTVSDAIALTGSTITIPLGSVGTYAGTLSGTGSLTLTGGGTLNYTGSAPYATGVTTVTAGTLAFPTAGISTYGSSNWVQTAATVFGVGGDAKTLTLDKIRAYAGGGNIISGWYTAMNLAVTSTGITCWLKLVDSTFVKGVKLAIDNGSTGTITARLLSAKYTSGTDLNFDFETGGTASTVATSSSASGYGCSNLLVGLPMPTRGGVTTGTNGVVSVTGAASVFNYPVLSSTAGGPGSFEWNSTGQFTWDQSYNYNGTLKLKSGSARVVISIVQGLYQSSTIVYSGITYTVDVSGLGTAGSEFDIKTVTVNSGAFVNLYNTISATDQAWCNNGNQFYGPSGATIRKTGAGYIAFYAPNGTAGTQLANFYGTVQVIGGTLGFNLISGADFRNTTFNSDAGTTIDFRNGNFNIKGGTWNGTTTKSYTNAQRLTVTGSLTINGACTQNATGNQFLRLSEATSDCLLTTGSFGWLGDVEVYAGVLRGTGTISSALTRVGFTSGTPAYIHGGTGPGSAGTLTVKNLAFDTTANVTGDIRVYSNGTTCSKIAVTGTFVNAVYGVRLHLMEALPAGTYVVVSVPASGTTVPATAVTVSTNNSGRTVSSASWVAGVGLRVVLA